jgi:hypothetical protein
MEDVELEQKIAQKIREACPNLDYTDVWVSHGKINKITMDGHFSLKELKTIVAILDEVENAS